RDARGNPVVQHLAPGAAPGRDLLGNTLYQHGMDSGERWTLPDGAAGAWLGWDENEAGSDDEQRLSYVEYDGMRRPVARWLRVWPRPTGSGQAFAAQPREQLERIEYQDAVAADDDNLNGQVVRQFDPSGLTETLNRDFDGNVCRTRRRLLRDTHASRVD